MIKQLIRDQALVDDSGKMTQRTVEWARQVTNLSLQTGAGTVNIITGSGSPEEVVAADQTALYMNTAGEAGSILYVKKFDNVEEDRTKGWILV
jgi:hypothetical protein